MLDLIVLYALGNVVSATTMNFPGPTTTTVPLETYNATCSFWTLHSQGSTFYITFSDDITENYCIATDLQTHLSSWTQTFNDSFDIVIDSSGEQLPNISNFATLNIDAPPYTIMAFRLGVQLCDRDIYKYLNSLTIKNVVCSYVDIKAEFQEGIDFFGNEDATCFESVNLILVNVRGNYISFDAHDVSIVNSTFDYATFNLKDGGIQIKDSFFTGKNTNFIIDFQTAQRVDSELDTVVVLGNTEIVGDALTTNSDTSKNILLSSSFFGHTLDIKNHSNVTLNNVNISNDLTTEALLYRNSLVTVQGQNYFSSNGRIFSEESCDTIQELQGEADSRINYYWVGIEAEVFKRDCITDVNDLLDEVLTLPEAHPFDKVDTPLSIGKNKFVVKLMFLGVLAPGLIDLYYADMMNAIQTSKSNTMFTEVHQDVPTTTTTTTTTSTITTTATTTLTSTLTTTTPTTTETFVISAKVEDYDYTMSMYIVFDEQLDSDEMQRLETKLSEDFAQSSETYTTKGSDGLSTGAIIGISIGSACGAILLGLFVYYLSRNSKNITPQGQYSRL